jgi:phenylacetate-coenzyme A ligase PaaK-like adenylate-forming protein
MYHLARALPDFFRERITVERAGEEIRRSLDQREESFLKLAGTRIYNNPPNPYLKLLKIAGCEISDLRSDVQRHGLERTLERLASVGVYLTADEFKGKKEVVRGRESFRVSPGDFQAADSSPGFIAQSSGSSGRPIRSVLSLDLIAAWALGHCVLFSAHRLFSHSHAVYDAMLPTSGSVINLLMNARIGITTDRWFARKIPVTNSLASWYHYLASCLIVWRGRQYSRGFPRPEPIAIDEIHRIVHWVVDKGREGSACCIRTTASNATRIARLAWEMGISLEGTKFIVSGEPFTEPKREVIERAGAGAIVFYGAAPGMYIGFGCANPLEADEVHVNEYMLALVAHPMPLSQIGPPISPLLFTTLHPSAPAMLLNVEIGDYATFARRDCGCPLERAGLTLHLHHIRSYEKFTSEGMNYFYGDLYECFEKTLPAEFGGGPGDYQLVEEEDENGQTRLTLRVHPQVGAIDEQKVLHRLRDELARGSWADEFQTRVWQNAGTFRISRAVPDASARGKILPLHIRR